MLISRSVLAVVLMASLIHCNTPCRAASDVHTEDIINVFIGVTTLPREVSPVLEYLLPSDGKTQKITLDQLIEERGDDLVKTLIYKIQSTLAEGASPESAGLTRFIEMPKEDQKRINIQERSIELLSRIYRSDNINNEQKKVLLVALYSMLKSPYSLTRLHALGLAAFLGKKTAVEHIIPLLEDPDKYIRVDAADRLSEIGDTSTADRIESIIQKRATGLTPEQIDNDWSFRHGYKAITKLRKADG